MEIRYSFVYKNVLLQKLCLQPILFRKTVFKCNLTKWGMIMDSEEYGSVNVMPKGAVEPISDMEMVIAKVKYDAHQTYLSINSPTDKNRHKEV